MEIPLRAALVDWLRADPALAALNLVEEEIPIRAHPPWLGIAASASADWGAKDRAGREVRIAFELHCRGSDPAGAAQLVASIEARIGSFPRMQASFHVASTRFLRARVAQRANNTRAILLEYRFRLLAQ